MKEIIIMVTILAIIICGGIYVQNYISKTTQDLSDQLESIKYKVQESDDIKYLSEDYNKINENWDELNKKWSIIILHDEIDNIEGYLLGIKSAIESNDKDEALEKIEISIFLMHHINEKEKLSIINIF